MALCHEVRQEAQHSHITVRGRRRVLSRLMCCEEALLELGAECVEQRLILQNGQTTLQVQQVRQSSSKATLRLCQLANQKA